MLGSRHPFNTKIQLDDKTYSIGNPPLNSAATDLESHFENNMNNTVFTGII